MDQSPELDQLLQQFCQLEDDDDLQAFLQDHHAALLTEEAETKLAHLAQTAADEPQRQRIDARLQLVQTLRMRQAMADLPPAERLFVAFMAARSRQDINSLVLQVTEADLDELEALAASKQAEMETEEQAGVQQRLADLRQIRQQLQATFGERVPLFKRLNGWIQTDSWPASAAYLQAHADELLADAAEQVLLQLLEDAPDNPTLQQHQTLLQESRTLGIEQAYANRAERAAETESSIDPDRAQALADKLAAWIQQETLDEAEAYLRRHQADLLSDEGLAVMEMLVQANAGNPQVRNHRQRLVRAHESGIDEMYAGFRRERLQERMQEALTQQGPIGQAVYQLVQIEDDDTAAALLQTQQDLLLTWDAGNLLNQLLAAATDAGNETMAARLQTRQQQWQAARIGPAAGQTLSTTGQKQQLSEQAGQAKYEIELAAFTAIGDNAVTLNVLNFGAVTLKWRRPRMARRDLTEPAVGRFDELQTLHQKLGENIAVVGKGRSGAVRGMPGVGKSTLAALYAQKYGDDYPGGVLWLQLGPSFTTEESVLPEISRLAAIAYSGDGSRFQLELPGIKAEPQTMEQIQRTLQNAIFTPEAVQRLLAGHGRLLVIVDDVWARKVLPAVRRALPPEAQLLVTTRDNRVAKAVGQSLPLDVLSKADALELIHQHLPAVAASLAERLIGIVGAHPMALQIALGDLDRDDPPSEWAEALDRIEQRLAEGLGVDPTSLQDIDPEQRLSAILPVSYEALARQENLQRCFRALGSMAREADFPLAAAAAICELPEAETRNLLKLLRDRNLLRRQPDAPDRWQQHTILRSYALEQQNQAERLIWAERHAAYFLETMRTADDAQTYYLLAPDLPNLRHAFAWAAGEGRALGLVQAILSNCANLLQSQNLGLEYLAWAEQVMALTEKMGSSSDRGGALLSYGNALQNAATLIYGTGRAERLKQALAAYDEALKLRRDVPLDYAQTQNNRAVLLSDLATLPGEDRAERLKQALAAYDEALHLRRDVPLDYAQTQNNRANLLRDLATLPGEDRAERLKQAVIDVAEAWPILATQADHLLQIVQTTLARLVVAMEPEAFRAAWTEATTLPVPTLPAALLLSTLASQAGIGSQAEFTNRLENDPDFKAAADALLEFAAAGPSEDDSEVLQALAKLLIDWINTPDWAASQTYLAQHAGQLLTGEAEQALQRLQQANPDAAGIPQHLALLRRCRAAGIDAAYQELEAMRTAAQDPALQAMQALLQVTDAGSFEAAVKAHPTLKELATLQRLTGAVLQSHRDEEPALARHLLALLLSLFQIYDSEHSEQIEPEAQEQFIELHDTLLPVAEELDNGEGLPASVRESSGWALNTLGNYYAQQKEHVQAVESYSRAIAAAPQTAMLYRNRAGQYLELRQVEAARQDIEQAAQLEPEAARLPELWCGLYLAQGDGPAMLPHAQRLQAANPDGANYHYYQALAQTLAGAMAEARAAMHTYSQHCSNDERAEGLRRLAQLQERQPALASAWQELSAILEDKPNPMEETDE